MTCKERIMQQLCSIPVSWRTQIANVICGSDSGGLDCTQIKNCETLTTLSEFAVNGTEVCVTYTGEDGIANERCFDFQDMFSLDPIDPKCVADIEVWPTMTFTQQWQAIIDKVCIECDGTTTTTSSTTTSSTTSTTTIVPTTTTTTTSTSTTTSSTTTTTTVVEPEELTYSWYWSDENPYIGDNNAPTIELLRSDTHMLNTPMWLDVHDMGTQKYIVLEYEDVEDNVNIWKDGLNPTDGGINNAPFNSGVIPDSAFRAIFATNGKKYLVSRTPLDMDTLSNSRLKIYIS